VSDDQVFVGAPSSSSPSGLVYVYSFDGTSWILSQTLLAGSSLGRTFGYSLALETDTLAVGAPGANEGPNEVGAVMVYRLADGTWVPEQKLVAQAAEPGGRLGSVVALSNGRIACISNRGVHYFERLNGSWRQLPTTLRGSRALFESLALFDGGAVVGAPRDADLGDEYGAVYVLPAPMGAPIPVAGVVGPLGAVLASLLAATGHVALRSRRTPRAR